MKLKNSLCLSRKNKGLRRGLVLLRHGKLMLQQVMIAEVYPSSYVQELGALWSKYEHASSRKLISWLDKYQYTNWTRGISSLRSFEPNEATALGIPLPAGVTLLNVDACQMLAGFIQVTYVFFVGQKAMRPVSKKGKIPRINIFTSFSDTSDRRFESVRKNIVKECSEWVIQYFPGYFSRIENDIICVERLLAIHASPHKSISVLELSPTHHISGYLFGMRSTVLAKGKIPRRLFIVSIQMSGQDISRDGLNNIPYFIYDYALRCYLFSISDQFLLYKGSIGQLKRMVSDSFLDISNIYKTFVDASGDLAIMRHSLIRYSSQEDNNPFIYDPIEPMEGLSDNTKPFDDLKTNIHNYYLETSDIEAATRQAMQDAMSFSNLLSQKESEKINLSLQESVKELTTRGLILARVGIVMTAISLTFVLAGFLLSFFTSVPLSKFMAISQSYILNKIIVVLIYFIHLLLSYT